MGIKSRIDELNMVVGGYLKSFHHGLQEENYPIDFVVTWVDGNDPAWQKERAETLGQKEKAASGNGVGRYRDWSSFRYWFRAVETYAPWVRYVHLVTWGHVPEWLKLDCPKLRIVNHKDYVPEEYLPTFNCQPLELNLFRIPDLSEHFVYFNDDMLLARPVTPKDFFCQGKPLHTGVAYPYINRDNEVPTYLFFNTYGAANKKNNIQECMKRHPKKWFSYKYGRMLKYNLEAWRNAGIPSMYFTHMGAPYCKSTMEQTWKKYEAECVYSCKQKVRDFHQITHQIFSIEDILQGNFEPAKVDWGACVAIDNIQEIASVYRNKQVKMICLFDRDNLTSAEVERIDKEIVVLYEGIFPVKSQFEK